MKITKVNGIKFASTLSRHLLVTHHQRTPGSNITNSQSYVDTNRFKDLLLSESYKLSRSNVNKQIASDSKGLLI